VAGQRVSSQPRRQDAAKGRADLLWLIRDARARALRALEALLDGDFELAGHVLDDLSEDLWRALERVERR
jgi:hypothetical protein